MSIIDQMRLRIGWKRTRKLLHAAAAMIGPALRNAKVNDALAEYEEFIAYHELECAMNMLEIAGDEAQLKALFWQQLALAAENMELTHDAEEFRRRSMSLTLSTGD